MSDIQTIGVVGAGTMGSGIAHVFARSGFRVLLCDVEQRLLDRALSQIRANLGREAAKGKLSESDIDPALACITPIVDREALSAAEFVVEAASERFQTKSEIFRALDRILPAGRRPRHQHLLHLHHQTRRPNPPPRANHRHALL